MRNENLFRRIKERFPDARQIPLEGALVTEDAPTRRIQDMLQDAQKSCARFLAENPKLHVQSYLLDDHTVVTCGFENGRLIRSYGIRRQDASGNFTDTLDAFYDFLSMEYPTERRA